ncbi:hypothetical protein EGI32_14355 [Ferruginibacter sp. HRS2-29]|nr:hypothetical protein [Ferruginibacter sp. HRS2-29]
MRSQISEGCRRLLRLFSASQKTKCSL